MTQRRAVVTGIGPVTPVGIGRESFWTGLLAGRSGIRRVEGFESSSLPVQIAGQVRGFDPSDFLDGSENERLDRYVQFAVAASKLAWLDAGCPDVEPSRAGVVISTGIGGIASVVTEHVAFLRGGWREVSPSLVTSLSPGAAAARVAIEFGFTGPNSCISTACAAGAHAVWQASRYITAGWADLCLAGGSEALVFPGGLVAFANMRALSRNPDAERASRPFDAARDGFVLSEGACVLVLEEAGHAEARGARIFAELAGFGVSADAHHITQPEPTGASAVMAIEAALAEAGEAADAVGYVNAHGSSTRLNDTVETLAIKKALGDRAYEIPVSATKSMTGHMLGASGAVEAAATALTLWTGVAHPTVNHENPDLSCDLDYVPNVARRIDARVALSNAFAFGGHNVVIALRR